MPKTICARGRCYFPEDELREAGLSAAQVADAPADFLPIYQRWIAEARAGLDAGLEYSIAINPPRVRIATVLPALIGVRTLELLERKPVSLLCAKARQSSAGRSAQDDGIGRDHAGKSQPLALKAGATISRHPERQSRDTVRNLSGTITYSSTSLGMTEER